MNTDELKTFVFLKYGKPTYSVDWFEQLPDKFIEQLYSDHYSKYNASTGITIIDIHTKRVVVALALSDLHRDRIMDIVIEYYKKESEVI